MQTLQRSAGVIQNQFKATYGAAIHAVIKPITDRLFDNGIECAEYAESLSRIIDHHAPGQTEIYSQVIILPHRFGDSIESRTETIIGVGHIIDSAIDRRGSHMIGRSKVRSHWDLSIRGDKWLLDLESQITRIH